MRQDMTMRRAVLALLVVTGVLGAVSCGDPTAPPAQYCGVDTITVPVVIGGIRYRETLLIPRRCP